jgi:dTDP-4-dehydrorhamnose reductase
MVEYTNGKILYVSTDYVFDGNKGNYKENDMTNPINYYGYTKLKGEEEVKNFCSDYVIARTSVIYGAHKPNFVTWVISQLSQNKQVSIVTDQIISPTHTLDLSEQINSLIKHDVKGIYHTAGGEQLSRFDFTKEIAKVFNLDEELIAPVSMNNINWVAKRPKNSSLDISKITKFKKPYTVKHSLQVLKDTFSGVEG